MSRSFGWTLLTTRSPIEIVPDVMFSRPASMRSRVDLPQPEGPTSTTNSPSSIGMVTPCRTSNPPNDLRTSRICTDDIDQFPPRTLEDAHGRCRGPGFVAKRLSRIFWRCRWIIVVGFRPLPLTLRRELRHAKWAQDMMLHIAKACVQCGRNHE